MSISVSHTSDISFVREVVSTPGMIKLCMGGFAERCDIDSCINDKSLTFFKVEKDGRIAGLVSFRKVDDGICEIHVALRTIGQDTRDAVRNAIEQIKNLGFGLIFAAYHPSRRAIDILAQDLGFEFVGNGFFNGEPMIIRRLKIS